ncbi:unnamed protein product [Clavelina lepadiformis]|uniref:Uncharacterized protein n=1 Tax=Clavelina lepadiformis TaxID=159417 RepID=A0ABP0GK63_CLALP
MNVVLIKETIRDSIRNGVKDKNSLGVLKERLKPLAIGQHKTIHIIHPHNGITYCRKERERDSNVKASGSSDSIKVSCSSNKLYKQFKLYSFFIDFKYVCIVCLSIKRVAAWVTFLIRFHRFKIIVKSIVKSLIL